MLYVRYFVLFLFCFCFVFVIFLRFFLSFFVVIVFFVLFFHFVFVSSSNFRGFPLISMLDKPQTLLETPFKRRTEFSKRQVGQVVSGYMVV